MKEATTNRIAGITLDTDNCLICFINDHLAAFPRTIYCTKSG